MTTSQRKSIQNAIMVALKEADAAAPIVICSMIGFCSGNLAYLFVKGSI